MIPLHLSIEGLYSYQKKQEIDFRRLTEAHIFGIFGATGSGKSSILEAITFALYGQSERLNLRENRGYNMMNLRSDRLQIEFTFESEGKTYLFAVSGRRNSKRFDDVKTFERQAYDLTSSSPIPLAHSSAEELLGLSYENFKRTIIIPQGQFQEFLQLTETERTRMLREIFHLGKFELSSKAISLERKANIRIAQTESLLTQYTQISSELLQEKEQAAAQLLEQSQQLERHLKQQQQQYQEQETLQQLFAELALQQSQLDSLTTQLPEIQAQEQRLQAYERCLRDFKPLLDRKQELNDELSQVKQSLQQKQHNHQEGEGELKKKSSSLQSMEEAYQKREEWKRRAEETREVIRLKKSAKNVQALHLRLQNGEQKITELKTESQQLRTQVHTHEAQVKELREKQPGLDRLLPIRDWYQEQKKLQLTLDSAQEEAQAVQKQLDKLLRQQHQILEKTSLDQAQYDLPLAQLLALLHRRQEEISRQQAEQQSQQNQLRTRQQLQQFAEQLTEGEPCPLCGAVHHPLPMSTESLTEALVRLEDELTTLATENQQAQRATAQLEALGQQQEDLKKRKEQRRNSSQTASATLDAHRRTFRWDEKHTEPYLDDQVKRIAFIENQIKAISQQKEAQEITIRNQEQTAEDWSKALDKLKEHYQAETISFESGKKALQYVRFESHVNEPDASIEELAMEFDNKYKSIESLYQQIDAQVRKLRSTLDGLRGEIRSLEEREKQLQKRLVSQNQELDLRLAESSFANLQGVRDILVNPLDLEREKQEIRKFHEQQHAAEIAVRTLRSKTQGKAFEADSFEALGAEIKALEEKKSSLMIEHGSLQKEIERLRADWVHKQQLEAELLQLQTRAVNLNTLKRMFQKSGFVNYVSTMYLENLCQSANGRFQRLTRGSLSLETTESNSFQVRDFLNDGQVRSVKTLSGGQTFQASLSLAIALADQVQQQAKSKQNFFFLDEGFGSQDKESLQVIFQTLKSLRKENRIVGIISHVEDLQEEIDSYLRITNDPQTGSQVKGSWE